MVAADWGIKAPSKKVLEREVSAIQELLDEQPDSKCE